MKVYTTPLFLLLSASFIYAQTPSFDTTFVNNKLTLKITTKTIHNNLLILRSTSGTYTVWVDTIEGTGLSYIKYPDFDKDGNRDILIDYYGNNSSYVLYLFDPKMNTFREIENYLNFPDAIQLKTKPNYYYSYHRAGCGDANWVSDFFKIQNFTVIHLGHISGKGCDADIKEEPQVIKIFKVTNNNEEKKTLIEELPYLKHIPHFNYKWTFIKKYWNKNSAIFE